jgi:hypothetical protein
MLSQLEELADFLRFACRKGKALQTVQSQQVKIFNREGDYFSFSFFWGNTNRKQIYTECKMATQ